MSRFEPDQLQQVYNEFASTYDENRSAFDISAILDAFFAYINTGDLALLGPKELLDLGCGAGEPTARYFADRDWKITGVDFSDRMLALASKYVPEMETVFEDITRVEFDHNRFDALTAAYSLFHIPAEFHLDVFRKCYQWLKPNGRFLFTYATKDYTGAETFNGYKEFLSTALYYSHKTTTELFDDLQTVGFDIVTTENHRIGGETFLWVTVNKPRPS